MLLNMLNCLKQQIWGYKMTSFENFACGYIIGTAIYFGYISLLNYLRGKQNV